MIKFIDMFSGIGGFREGLTRAGGFECVGQSEIYNPPAGYAWQVVALVGEEIAGGTEIPDVPSVRNRSTIPLHGQLPPRLPAAALI